jgi:ornithine cyclodeaminase
MSAAADPMLILSGQDVRAILAGRELEIVDCVADAYRAHACGRTSVPHSLFLTFPDDPASRIIALPAYVDTGQGQEMAGMKWVSSFPANVRSRMDRASAVVILSSTMTGQPLAIMEGSTISARRTAASAALAASKLHQDPSEPFAGVVGCGVINFEIVRFLAATRPALRRLSLFDIDPLRAGRFQERCRLAFPHLEVEVASDMGQVLARTSLLSLATTASAPHLEDLRGCRPGTLILHISLRDIAPAAIMECDNVADDVDHVCRAGTSLHLAEQLVGHRRFIRCSLGEVLMGTAPARLDSEGVAVFSPFGLGILDVSLATMVSDDARARGVGMVLDDFLPQPWTEDTLVVGPGRVGSGEPADRSGVQRRRLPRPRSGAGGHQPDVRRQPQ